MRETCGIRAENPGNAGLGLGNTKCLKRQSCHKKKKVIRSIQMTKRKMKIPSVFVTNHLFPSHSPSPLTQRHFLKRPSVIDLQAPNHFIISSCISFNFKSNSAFVITSVTEVNSHSSLLTVNNSVNRTVSMFINMSCLSFNIQWNFFVFIFRPISSK